MGVGDYNTVLETYEGAREGIKRVKIGVKDKHLSLVDDKNVVERKDYFKHKTADFGILFHPNPSCVTDVYEYEAQTRAVVNYVNRLDEPYVIEKNTIVPARLSDRGKFTSKSGS